MTSSAPNKQFEGQTGFPTPNAAPDENGCRVFSIPSDEEYFAIFMAAVDKLTYPYNWYKNGDLSPDEAAAKWSDIIEQAIAISEVGQCGEMVPAPYWDETTADDADDEMPVLEQTWYGQIVATPGILMAEDAGLTFLDNVGIWIIAGFIAYAGLPGAAIAFVPVAKRFTLAFKQHDLGGIVRVLADFAEIAEIDTYGVEDKILNVPVVFPDDATTLYVEMSDTHNPAITGDPNIQVIRKELTEDTFSNPAYRYNSDCDCVQYSPDGGTTWNDAPGSDPRIADAYRLPHRTGTDRRCDAAANMVKWLKDFCDSIAGLLDAGATITAIVNEILRFAILIFGLVIDALITLILDVAAALFGLGAAAFTSLTSDQYDLLLCIFFCNADADGQISESAFASVKSQVTAQLNTTAGIIINTILSLQGQVGLSNAGTLGTETADCTACPDTDFCHVWGADGTPFDAAFNWSASYSGGYGVISGGKWVGVNTGSPSVNCIIELAPSVTFTVDTVEIVYSNHNNNGDRPDCLLFLAGVQVARIDQSNASGSSQDDATATFSFGGVLCDTIELVNIANGNDYLVNYSRIQVSGSGACGIFGADNC